MRVILFLGLSLLLAGCGAKQSPVLHIDNIAIPSSLSKNGHIVLKDGLYQEGGHSIPGMSLIIRTSEYIAQGQINQQDVVAAMIVINAKGKGPSYDLLLFKESNNGLTYLAQTSLGQAQHIGGVTIADNMIRVSLSNPTASNSQEPDLPLVKSFIFTEQTLREPCLPEPTPTRKPPPPLFAGQTYYWQNSLYGNDTEEGPNNGATYAITFNKDWTLTIHSDCNRVGGSFGLNGAQLTIRPAPALKTCNSLSMSPVFLRDLGDAVHYLKQDDNIYLDLIYDSGTMILTTKP